MDYETTDIAALVEAIEAFSKTTRTMEEMYRRLETRVRDLDRELADKNRELAVSRDYLSNLLESISDGVVAVDNAGVITRYNRAARGILGYDGSEVVGRGFEAVFGRAFSVPRLPGAMTLRAKSGRHVPINEHNSPIADDDGARHGNVKTFQDLSEITALREQVRQIDRLAAIGEMAATVAHEIRNPLGGIRGFATFLAEDTPESDARYRLITKIIEGAKSLEKVVSGLLEYTRPVELDLRQVSCAQTVDSAVAFLEHDAERAVVTNQVAKDLYVRADPDRMRQVFLNVLMNAVQSIESEGKVDVTATAGGADVTVCIADTGCGMTEEEQSRLFSPFFTTKEKGTGLGMAVCQKIVEGHGGEIRAESTIGQGTTVTIRLPRAEPG